MTFSKFTKLYNYHHNPVLDYFNHPSKVAHIHL